MIFPWRMKTLNSEPGTTWFVDLAVLPFLRRVEFYRSRSPLLFSGLTISGGLLAVLVFLGEKYYSPDWLKISLTIIMIVFIATIFLLHVFFPITKKHRELYKDLLTKGVFTSNSHVLINMSTCPNKKIEWSAITSFHTTIMESINNTEFLTIHTEKETISIPFLQLTDASRIPIPNTVEDEGMLYYCYSTDSRISLSAKNNDLYHEFLNKIGEREDKKRLERLSFECPYCGESFILFIHNWRLTKRDILFCDECPNILSIEHSEPLYQRLYELYAHEGVDTVLNKSDNQITFRGLVGVEPDEYTFELVRGSPEEVNILDKRGPEFQKAIESSLKKCPCGGVFTYQGKPRCLHCNHSLPELVNGLGYGRYAVINEEFPGRKMLNDNSGEFVDDGEFKQFVD